MTAGRIRLVVEGKGIAPSLLNVFARLLPVDFKPAPPQVGREDEIRLIAAGPDVVRELVLSSTRRASRTQPAGKVSFADSAEVPFPFRSRSVHAATAGSGATLAPVDGETVLAATADGPVWSVSTDPGRQCFRSALPLPAPEDAADTKTAFFDFFNASCFVDALPLVHFLRVVCGDADYAPPCLRASFVIDDPNLHRPRYGYVNYRDVILNAQANNYHVAFATVPLDTWYTHRDTAALFKAFPGLVSLMVHGNNHSKGELVARYSEAERRSLLRQSLDRMERLTRHTGLGFARVMVPPHGACDHAMLQSLPLCGFESACISHGSLRGHNPTRDWTTTLGYRPSEVIEHCPVLPRWGLGGSVENTVLLAAYLGQALVVMGHHHDLADGMANLNRVAALINGLGTVTWGDMTTLSRLNYLQKRDGAMASVRAYGSTIRLLPDPTCEHVVVEPVASGAPEWRTMAPDVAPLDIDASGPHGSAISRLARRGGTCVDPGVRSAVSLPPLRHLVRRLLTESRDRLAPLGSAFSRRGA